MKSVADLFKIPQQQCLPLQMQSLLQSGPSTPVGLATPSPAGPGQHRVQLPAGHLFQSPIPNLASLKAMSSIHPHFPELQLNALPAARSALLSGIGPEILGASVNGAQGISLPESVARVWICTSARLYHSSVLAI